MLRACLCVGLRVGLLSAHFLASDAALFPVAGYNGELLRLAEDLARRLLPAFDTPTGIPYGTVLQKNVLFLFLLEVFCVLLLVFVMLRFFF